MKRLLIPLIALAMTLAVAAPAAAEGGGPSNIVIANSHSDAHIAVQGRIQVNHAGGQVAAPLNLAMARAVRCVGCQTLAVALQLDFASRDARYIAPQNVAVATNVSCDSCVTVAKAVQVFFTVDDPTQIPPEISDAMRSLEVELRAITTEHDISLADAESRVDAVIARFLAIATAYDQQRQMAAQ